MSKTLIALFGADSKGKRIKRGAIGGVVALLLSAIGGGMSGVGVVIPIFMFILFGTICAVLTPINILRSIGICLILLGGTIVLGLTVDPMDKGQGFYFLALGSATWWSALKKFFQKNKINRP